MGPSHRILLAVTLASLLPACASSEVARLREEVNRLREEVRATRQAAGKAVETARSLDVKTELHAFLQRDEALARSGSFPALEERIRRGARSYVFLLRSDTNPRQPLGLFFRVGSFVRIDFVAGSGDASTGGNRLEVFGRKDTFDFEPLNMARNEFGSYMLEENQELVIRTLNPGVPVTQDGVPMSQVLFRYHPVGGPGPYRVAYVRVTFLEEGGVNGAEPGAARMPRVQTTEEEPAE